MGVHQVNTRKNMSSKEIEAAVGTLYPFLVYYGFPINDMKLEQLGKALFEKNCDKLNLLKYGLSKLGEDIEAFLDKHRNLERGITQILQDLKFLPEGSGNKFIKGDDSIKEQVAVWKKLLDCLEVTSTDDSFSEMDVNRIFKEAMNTYTNKDSGSDIEQLINKIQCELDNYDDNEINGTVPVNNIISTEGEQPEDGNGSLSDIDKAIKNFSSKFISEIHLPQDLKKAKIPNREELCSVMPKFRESLFLIEKLLEDLRNCMK